MTPQPPYYAVIFSAARGNVTEQSNREYLETATRMFELASTIPGYIGVETAHQKDGFGVTISYWKSKESIKIWRDNTQHVEARRRGKKEWYSNYKLRVTKVERAYEWSKIEK